jgi:hypothetical protein
VFDDADILVEEHTESVKEFMREFGGKLLKTNFILDSLVSTKLLSLEVQQIIIRKLSIALIKL